MYTYQEVYEASKDYFNGNDLAAKVFVDKYALQDNDGNYHELTPHDMHDRLASEFARIDKSKYKLDYAERYELYRSAFNQFSRIVAQGSVMNSVGNKYQKMSASNCVVISPPEDNMGSIIDSGKALAQLYKRRCVEEGSYVITKEKGHIPIKYVEPGQHVLSFDIKSKKTVFKKIINKFYTDVLENDRVVVTFKNGARLKTSKKHPILSIDANYKYILVGDLKVGDVGIRPPLTTCKINFPKTSKNMQDMGWFIGAHIGDGSCDLHVHKQKRTHQKGTTIYKSDQYRFRNTGDNKDVIDKYGLIFNKIAKKAANVHKSYRKDYSVDCWEFCSSAKSNKIVLDKYLDGQIGSKTYSAFIPKFIRKNNLFWPFLVGLIDTDGHIKDNGQCIDISICASKVIDELGCFLESQGVNVHIAIINNNRDNEHIIYRLKIKYNKSLWKYLSKNLSHKIKADRLIDREVKPFSLKYHLTNNEHEGIIDVYNSIDNKQTISKNKKFLNLLSANIGNLFRSKNKSIGVGALNSFVNANILKKEKCDEITQRVWVKSIEQDYESSKYVDIEVEGTNNFYCGHYGLIVIHNCGVGLDISKLRPDGMSVSNAAKSTSGAWSFADFYSYITRMVGQSSRRGALMITLDVHHPDIVKFTTMKHDETKVTGANVSVKLSDEFLHAVENGNDYEQRWPCSVDNAKTTQQVNAQKVWQTIINSATTTADPGLLFFNNIKKNLPADFYEELTTSSTNPCSEIPLGEFDSCRLISINLTGYVRKAFEEDAYFDFKSFKKDIQLAIHAIDNLVDLEFELIDEIKKVCDTTFELNIWNKLKKTGELGRRTGLGTHALGDTLAQLKARYDSDEAIEIVDKIYKTLRDESYMHSVELAKERGPFPLFDWEKEKKCEFIKRLPKRIKKAIKEHGRRNVSINTQAPTGSVALLSKVGEFNRFNTSSGVEPVFRNFYTRRKKINPGDEHARVDYIDQLGDSWQEFKVYHSNVKNYLEKFNCTETDLPEYFVTADQVGWNKRIALQATEQQYIDHAISATINLPKGTKSDIVGNIYMEAWKQGLKGVTVYVDGSKDAVLVTDNSYKKDLSGRPTSIISSHSPKRPKEVFCDIIHTTVKGEGWTVLVGLLNNEPYELFMGKTEKLNIPSKLSKGKIIKIKRGHYKLLDVTNDVFVENIIKAADNEEGSWTTRMMSTSLRHGVPIEYLVEQLSKDGSVVDVNNVLARLLRKYIKKKTQERSEQCPQCGGHEIVYSEGCKKCADQSCGWSGCS